MADYVGDSLGLSREAAATEADVIVLCGVHFMAETAAMLSPEKTVLIPDPTLAARSRTSISAERCARWKASIRARWSCSYVNTTAEVKARVRLLLTRETRQIIGPIPADAKSCSCPTCSWAPTWSASRAAR